MVFCIRHLTLILLEVESSYESFSTMAANAVNDPALGGVPFALQLPFGADPGSLTGWLLEKSSTDTPTDIVESVARAFARYAELPPVANAEYEAELTNLYNEILSSDDLCSFLTVSTAPGQPPVVTVVSALARYSVGFGGVSAHNGKSFCFRGEAIDAVQMPPLIEAPELAILFKPRDVVVPNLGQVTGHYANPVASLLMPAPVAGANTVQFARLVFVPKAWAPYFLGGMLPHQAYQTGTALVAGLPTVELRTAAETWLGWLAASCMRQGNAETLSEMNVAWKGVAAERKLLKWASARIAPFRSPLLQNVPFVPQANVGIGVPLQVAAAPAPTQAAFSPMELQSYRAACSLSEAEFSIHCPKIFQAFLDEGRKPERIETVLSKFLVPDLDDDFPVDIFVSQELIKDIKQWKFGYGNDRGFDTCHRGISPFAVIPLTSEHASHRRRAHDRFKAATTVSVDDVARFESNPGPIPRDFEALLSLLWSYQKLLVTLFGKFCSHLLEVNEIRRVLLRGRNHFVTVTQEQIAHILWAIFSDARNFFSLSNQADELPKSGLAITRGMLQSGTILEQACIPMTRLLGKAQAPPPIAALPVTSAGALFPSAPSPFASHVNKGYHAELKTLIAPVVAKYPSVRATALLQASTPAVSIATLPFPKGGCLDFYVLGRCDSKSCRYKHQELTSPMGAVKVAKLVTLLTGPCQDYKP